MCEGLYRTQQAALRLFGPSARLTGTAGSAKGPGEVRIVVDGRTLGRGQTFRQALEAVTAGSLDDEKAVA
jgi:hypothetical protein